MNRRSFVGALGVAALASRRLAAQMPDRLALENVEGGGGGGTMAEGFITDVEGISVGHFTDTRRPTGCTVILCGQGVVAGVDVRGSAPGTRETDLLHPTNTVDRVNAILLSGGSAFGLDAASGVVRYLDEHGIGFPTGGGAVPIVPAAVLYDLTVGDGKIRPTAESGYKACQSAKTGPVEEGNVGAGAGATVGKLGDGKPMKSGIGTSSIKLPDGLVVAAMVAANGVGDVIDPKTGQIVAGARTPDGKHFLNIMKSFRSGQGVGRVGLGKSGESTTIGVVATNAHFDKTRMTKIAQMAHDGLARAVNPTHTPYDGDTIFALSTGTSRVDANLAAIGALAAEMVTEAILRAVKAAKGIPGYPSMHDL
jgi:L-aminopeptidase/D-esterase-like protein